MKHYLEVGYLPSLFSISKAQPEYMYSVLSRGFVYVYNIAVLCMKCVVCVNIHINNCVVCCYLLSNVYNGVYCVEWYVVIFMFSASICSGICWGL